MDKQSAEALERDMEQVVERLDDLRKDIQLQAQFVRDKVAMLNWSLSMLAESLAEIEADSERHKVKLK